MANDVLDNDAPATTEKNSALAGQVRLGNFWKESREGGNVLRSFMSEGQVHVFVISVAQTSERAPSHGVFLSKSSKEDDRPLTVKEIQARGIRAGSLWTREGKGKKFLSGTFLDHNLSINFIAPEKRVERGPIAFSYLKDIPLEIRLKKQAKGQDVATLAGDSQGVTTTADVADEVIPF